MIQMLPILYYAFFFPLIILSLFLYKYRFGFKRINFFLGVKQCILWTTPCFLFLLFGIYHILQQQDAGPPGPGDGIILIPIVFFGLTFISVLGFIAFSSGYRKAPLSSHLLIARRLDIRIITLNILIFLFLLGGILVQCKIN